MAGSAGEQLFRGAESATLGEQAPLERDRAFLGASALLFVASAAGTIWSGNGVRLAPVAVPVDGS